MCICSDRDGLVNMNEHALARKANVTPDQLREALDVLSSPDPHSSRDGDDGRRIELLEPERRPWGWRVINKRQYLAYVDPDERRESARDRKRSQRERDQSVLFETLQNRDLRHIHVTPNSVTNVTQVNPSPSHKLELVPETNQKQDIEFNTSTHARANNERASEPALEVAAAVKLWNTEIADALHAPKATTQTAAAVIESWRRIRSDIFQVVPAFDLVECVRRAGTQSFLRDKPFMNFRWVFGSKHGEFNALKLWHRRYADARAGDEPRPDGSGIENETGRSAPHGRSNPFRNGDRPIKK